MQKIYEQILQALKPGTQVEIDTKDTLGVSLLIYVSERFDQLSITTNLAGNPSVIRISVNSREELSLQETIEHFDANIAVNVYGTLYDDMPLPLRNNGTQPFFKVIKSYRRCLQFVEEFIPILERFVAEVLSKKAIKLHNLAVAEQYLD
jgi:hypothetical protein